MGPHFGYTDDLKYVEHGRGLALVTQSERQTNVHNGRTEWRWQVNLGQLLTQSKRFTLRNTMPSV